jgi:hypothetical protein
MIWIVSAITALHFVISFVPLPRVQKEFRESFRQHHEKCFMLGLVALAILHR